MYVVGGLSIFTEDAEVRHGGGIGYGIGLGLQVNNTLALELLWDSAPEIHPANLNEYLESRPRDSSQQRVYDVEAESNKYVSLFGVASLNVNERMSLIGKVGVARYWRLETINFDLVSSTGEPMQQRTAIYEQSYSPVVSAGLRLNLPRFEKISIDLTITGFLQDSIESSFFGADIKFPFPKG